MRRRTVTIFTALAVVLGAALLVPYAAFACQITDPGCYIDDFTHRQLSQLALWLWQFNRAALVLARWLEDLRGWLIESVLVNAFTTLTGPISFLFFVALIVAWLVFVISFLVQSLVDLRWVDLRRALRPILLALFVFSAGGSVINGTEEVRVLGGSLLEQTALGAVASVQAPRIPTEKGGDLPDATTSIYSDGTSCGTPARAIAVLYLSDYSARYLWANAEDIHCATANALAGEFRSHYFPQQSIADQPDANVRQDAVALAAQGGLRQLTGLWLSVGAIIEQLVQLLFALALALTWFSLLLSLVFAVFLPTEELFSRQIKALLAVVRASWLASFLIGLGLALLSLVAASGNGLLLYLCGLALIAVCLWQGKQALATMSTAVEALGAAAGGAPQAVGGMVKSWATTAALVAGVAATGGGLGAVLGSVGSTMVRRAGRNAGDNPLAQAAGRVLSNRVADRIDARMEDWRGTQDANLSTAEAAWYERGAYDDAGTPEVDAAAGRQKGQAEERARAERAQVLERRAGRARRAGNFRGADRLRRQAAELRGGVGPGADERAERQTGPELDLVVPELDPASMERALEQLHEAQDDPQMQRRVLGEALVEAHRIAVLKAVRNRALREKRFDDAKAAIRALREQDIAAPVSTTFTPAHSATPEEAEISDLAREIGALEQLLAGVPADARVAIAASLVPLWGRLAAAQAAHAAQHPPDAALLVAATAPGGTPRAGQPLHVARTAAGLVAEGQAVTDSGMLADGRRFLMTDMGMIMLAAADGVRVQTLPVGQVLRVPTLAPDEEPIAETARRASAAPGSAASTSSTRANTPRAVTSSHTPHTAALPATVMPPIAAPPSVAAPAASIVVPDAAALPPLPISATPTAAPVPAAPVAEAPAAVVAAVPAAPAVAPAVSTAAPSSVVAVASPVSAVSVAPAPTPTVASTLVASASAAPAPAVEPHQPVVPPPRSPTTGLVLPQVPDERGPDTPQPPATATPPTPATSLQPWKRSKRGPS